MILPCVYSALPNKTTNSYVEMLNALKLIIKPLGSPLEPYLPNTALTDFELAIQNAFVHCFPLIKIKGCFFHFKQVVGRWIFTNGFKKRYQTDDLFKLWVRKVYCLAVCLPDRVEEAFEILSKEADNLTVNVQPILIYFNNTWINGAIPRDDWNQFDVLKDRTNNSVESYNRQVNRKLVLKLTSFKAIA